VDELLLAEDAGRRHALGAALRWSRIRRISRVRASGQFVAAARGIDG